MTFSLKGLKTITNYQYKPACGILSLLDILKSYNVSTLFGSPYYNKQECIPVGCIPSTAVAVSGWGVSAQEGGRGCLPGGCLPRGGVCARGCLPKGGVCPRGVSAWGCTSPLCGQNS